VRNRQAPAKLYIHVDFEAHVKTIAPTPQICVPKFAYLDVNRELTSIPLQNRYNPSVTQSASMATTSSRLKLGLAARLALLGAVFFTEKVLLNGLVEFNRAQAAQGVGALVRVAQHWGFRFLVAFAAALAVFAYVRGAQPHASDTELRWGKRNAGWLFGHALFFSALLPLTYFLYGSHGSALPFLAIVALWMVLGITTVLTGILAMTP